MDCTIGTTDWDKLRRALRQEPDQGPCPADALQVAASVPSVFSRGLMLNSRIPSTSVGVGMVWSRVWCDGLKVTTSMPHELVELD
jgi:hypothetical protein